MNINRTLLNSLLLVLPLFVLTTGVAQAQEWDGLQSLLWAFVNGVFGWLVGVAGVLLDYSIDNYVVGFGRNFLGSQGNEGLAGIGVAVDSLWITVRDFFNLTFIFGLVYLGFKMILNSDDSNTRKWLISLIMAALLVNFSLFITKFIIDVCNILATQIYTAGFQQNVSTQFMNAFSISGVWDSDNTLDAGAGFTYIFGSAIMFIIAAFVFFAGAIMLMIRYAVLSIYMVLSPVMFLGWVFPQLQSVSSKYWYGFLGKAFFAPVYILMLFFASTIMGNFFGSGSTSLSEGLGANGTATQAGVEATFPPFIITSIFLLAAVVIANKLGADGASQAIKIGNNLRGRAQKGIQNGAYGLGRAGVRNTAGWGALAVSAGAERTRQSLDRGLGTMAQGGTIRRMTARTIDRTVGAGLRSAEGASLAGSETMAQYRKRADEQQNKFNKTNKETKRRTDYYEQRAEIARQQALLDDASVTGIDRQRAETLKANADAALGAVLKEMSVDELRALIDANGGFLRDERTGAPRSNAEVLSDEVVAKHLTSEQVKGLGESGAYSNTQMKSLGTARTDGIFNTIEAKLKDTGATADDLTDALEELADVVQKYSETDVVKLGFDNLQKTTVAANLTQKQLDAIVSSGKFTAAEIAQIKLARETGLNQIATDGSLHIERANPITGAVSVQPLRPALDPSKSTTLAQQTTEFQANQRKKLFVKKPGQTDPLPIDIFTRPEMVEHLTPRALEQRINDGYISQADMAAIKNNVENYTNRTAFAAGSPEELRRQANQKMWRKWSKSNNNVIAAQANFDINPI